MKRFIQGEHRGSRHLASVEPRRLRQRHQSGACSRRFRRRTQHLIVAHEVTNVGSDCAIKPQRTPSTERRVRRWEHGASPDEVKVKLGEILQGADPPHSEAAVQTLLHDAGFGDATRFFRSLFWSAWLTCKMV